jgi:hypothetical protein
MVSGNHAGSAQSASVPADDGHSPFQILVTPYLWVPWINVGAHPADIRFPGKSTVITPAKLFGHITWVPFMGSAELRYGQFSLVTDYMHVPLTKGVSTRDILFNGANGGLTQDTGTAMFMYRAIMQPDEYLDIGIGVRGWGLAGTISVNQGLLPSVSVADGLSWADPLIGARYHRDFGDGYGGTAYADFGGLGGGSHTDWQIVATLDYTYNSRVDVHGGIRSLNFNYGAPRGNIKMNIFGPILSLTYRFSG